MTQLVLRFLCVLIVVFLCGSSCDSTHSVLQEGREVVRVNHGLDGVIWVVQISDIHISSYHPNRASSLENLAGPLLAVINPSLVLITGDLTDAKSKDHLSRRQDRAEWLQYRQTINKVIEDSGLPEYAFYDLRGNHDMFGVPFVGSRLDYFSKYSISSSRNRTSSIQSITFKNSGWKHLFVGLDTSMKVGLRGPCNLFGHPTEEQLRKLDEELSQWDTCPPDNVTKLVFGHFPVSFTASAEHGSRLEYTLAKHSVGAYICGHLHKSFGPNLIHHHLLPKVELHDCGNSTVNRKVEFWEWELGDWRKARTIRVIAIDQGHISFTDFSLSGLPVDAAHQREKWLPTLIVPTYPLDSYSMEQSAKPPYFMPSHDYVRSLIFSIQPPESVIARLYETTLGKLHLLEELEMVLKMKTGNSVYMYESPWQSAKYIDSANTQYSYKVSVVDVAGKVTESSLRSFSVQRKVSKLKKTWTEFLVMDLLWERAFVVLLRLALILFFILFICPKFILHFLLGNGRYEQWSYNLFRVGSQRLTVRRVFQLIAWFFIQGCTRTLIWWEQVFILLWLVLCPWFWGQVLGDGYPLGFMSIRGWMVQVNDSSPLYNDLGWPDILVIVIPYLYFVLLPLYFLIFTLSAEDFINKIDQVESSAVWQKKEKAFRTTSSEAKSSLPYKGLDKGEGGPFRCRWAWWIIMGGCLLVSVIHIGQVSAIAGAYGYMTVFASPGFAWPVPILMITTVFQSLSCQKH